MIRWRALFDHLRVEWRDRGANTARGRINVQCCWCGRNDPSFHLSIDEEIGSYYCLRVGRGHSGKSLPWLLLGLGVNPREIDGLISEFSDREYKPTAKSAPVQKFVWDQFESAATSPLCLDYLRTRGYEKPENVCAAYDLRFTRVGRFAWRLLLPLTIGTNQTGFTGRALRSNQQPRYLTNDEFGGSLFLPRSESASTLLLCEGPFDALAATFAGNSIRAAAILGTMLPPERLLCIASLARESEQVVYVPDKDQSYAATYRLIEELEGVPGIDSVNLVALPGRYKDLAEFWEHDKSGIVKWLDNVALTGRDHLSKPGQQSLSAKTDGVFDG